jgi:hypothetical protein
VSGINRQKKQARVSQVTKGDLIISHEENVCNVYGGMETRTFTVNAQNYLFRWLSAIAMRFEMYTFMSLSFRYIPTCPATTAGNAMIAFDFEATDQVPLAEDAKEWKFSSRNSCWKSFRLDVGKDERARGLRYCCSLDSSKQSLMRDLGRVHIFSEGVGSAVKTGEVRVSYTVRLHIPSISGAVLRRQSSLDTLTSASVLSGMAFFGGSSSAHLTFGGTATWLHDTVADDHQQTGLDSYVDMALGVFDNFYFHRRHIPPGKWDITINVGDAGGGITGAVTPVITADDDSWYTLHWSTIANDAYNTTWSGNLEYDGPGVRFVLPAIGVIGAILRLTISSVSIK